MTTTIMHLPKIHRSSHQKISIAALSPRYWKMACLACFLASVLLLVFYVWQINMLTSGSYTISTYQKEISNLAEENKNLQVSFAESSFLGQALAKAQALGFEKVTSAKYILLPDNYFAMAK